MNGGEAVVVSAYADEKGAVYHVRLLRSGRQRTVRRESLTVHRNQSKPKGPKGTK